MKHTGNWDAVILHGGYIFENVNTFDEIVVFIKNRIKKQQFQITEFTCGNEYGYQVFVKDLNFVEKKYPEITLIHGDEIDFLESVKHSEVVLFQGGNPRVYIEKLKHISLHEALGNKIIIGVSGGADILARFYGVGVSKRIGEGFGIVDVSFIPHFQSKREKFNDVDWDFLCNELKIMDANEIVILNDGEYKIFSNT